MSPESTGTSRSRRANLPPSTGAANAAASDSSAENTVDKLEALLKRINVTHNLVMATRDEGQTAKIVAEVMPVAKEALMTCDLLERQLRIPNAPATQLPHKIRVMLPMIVYSLAARRVFQIEKEVAAKKYRDLYTPDAAPRLEGAIADLTRLKQEKSACSDVIRHARQSLASRAPEEMKAGDSALLNRSEEHLLITGSSRVHVDFMLVNLFRTMTFEGLPPVILASMHEMLKAVLAATGASSQASKIPRTASANDENVRKHALHLIDKVDRLADLFAVAVTQDWNGPEEQWKGMLALANAMPDVLSAMRRMASGTLQKATANEPSADDASTSLAAPANGTSPSTEGRPAASESGAARDTPSRRARSRRTAHRPAAAATAAASASSAGPQAEPALPPRAAAIKQSGQLLRKHPLTPETASRFGGDPVAIARSMGKDTAALELMRREGYNPLSVATMTRTSAEWWFGRPAPMNAVRQELAAALRAHPGDAELKDAIAQVDGRLQALAMVERHLHVDEADSIKRHAFPRASHLERMLEMGEIASVARPTRLASAGDIGDLGTLFEIAVELKPLGDGDPARPLFLHLHTAEPVDAEACADLAADKIEALHVKTAAQRGDGARWEQIQRALGHADAKVHRGRLDVPLLKALLDVGAPATASRRGKAA